jgi:hypothetical protein
MLGPAFEMSRAISPNLWRRYLGLFLDGLHTGEHTELPAPPPGMESLTHILRAGKSSRQR